MGLTRKQIDMLIPGMSEASMEPYKRAQQSKENTADRDAALARLIKGAEIEQAQGQADLASAQQMRKQYGPEVAVRVGNTSLGDFDPTMRALREKKMREVGKPNSVFQETLDREAAKNIAEDINKGGSVRRESQVAEIEGIADKLTQAGERKEKGGLGSFLKSNLSGPLLGVIPRTAVPDAVRSVFDPEGLNTQQKFELIAQESLKETLGGQFAQQEAKEFFSRAYNPNLPPEALAQRVRLAAEVRRLIKNEKSNFENYAMQNQTIEGYPKEERDRALAARINEINRSLEDGTPTQQQGAPKGVDINSIRAERERRAKLRGR